MNIDRLTAALAGRYTIERELGQGGMATVYQAEDLKHRRRVAIKVLRPDLAYALGADRFLREIATTASLRHPHILPLHDSGDADGLLYYVMPLVEGESLRDRISRQKQLPIDEALRIAREVADALGYAHGRGVIHRDIKPENILLEGGHAVVADFGIARMLSAADSGRLTETGTSIGTPLYMSPEQAAGDPDLDGRSDLYSLGCVLYELLGGQPPFTGPTAESVTRQHMITDAAPITNLRPTVPAHVAGALARSLAKNPADRFNPAAQFIEAFSANAPSGAFMPTINGDAHGNGSRGRYARWIAVAAVAVAALWALMRPRAAPVLAIGHTEQLTAEPGLEIQPAISPDGKLVAYAAGHSQRMRIFIRPIGGGRTVPLSDDSTSVETHPVWSPDGSRLLFLTQGGVSVSPVLGGSARTVVPAGATAVTGATWSPDGRQIAYSRGDSVQVVPAEGGAARLIGAGAFDLHSCAWSPDGRWIACVAGNLESAFPGQGFGNLSPSSLVLFRATGGAPIRIVESKVFNQSPVWADGGGRLLFVSNRDGPRDVYAVDVTSTGTSHDDPVRITTGLNALSVSVSADGRQMVYAVYLAQANLWSLPVTSGSPVSPASAIQLTTSHQIIEYCTVSRDGKWLLYDSNLKGNADIYRIPIGGGAPEQLTSDSADEFGPDLSPDGREVAFHTWRQGTRDVVVKALAGGAVQPVAVGPTQESFPTWSPDGRSLLYWDQVLPRTGYVVGRAPDGSWGAARKLGAPIVFPHWSPDGRQIAFASQPPDQAPELMVMPVSGGPARRVFDSRATDRPAEFALWTPDGRTLIFKSHDTLHRTSFWAVPAAGGNPRLLTRLDDPNWQSLRPFFATDGKRLYFPVEDRQSDIYVAEVRR